MHLLTLRPLFSPRIGLAAAAATAASAAAPAALLALLQQLAGLNRSVPVKHTSTHAPPNR